MKILTRKVVGSYGQKKRRIIDCSALTSLKEAVSAGSNRISTYLSRGEIAKVMSVDTNVEFSEEYWQELVTLLRRTCRKYNEYKAEESYILQNWFGDEETDLSVDV